MMSLSRRKASLNKAEADGRLHHLPDDILILVASQCRLDELLALRLTSKRTREVIDEYISTIGPSVARSTFPQSELLLRLIHDGTRCTLPALLALIPQQLAAILVDRHHIVIEGTRSRYGIPAEEPWGDGLRARVANGWHVLRHLSNISREVHKTYIGPSAKSPTEVVQKLLHPSRFKLEVHKQREDIIQQQRLAYIQHLPRQTAQDYKLMTTLLSSVFNTSSANTGSEHQPWIFDWGDGIDGQRAFRQGGSWLTWFVLAEGPDIFWDQWWSLPPQSATNYIRDRAILTFQATDPALCDYQRSLAKTIQDAVHEKAGFPRDFDASNPYRYFTSRGWRSRVLEEDEFPFREIMEHVPFLVNFQYPLANEQEGADRRDVICTPLTLLGWQVKW